MRTRTNLTNTGMPFQRMVETSALAYPAGLIRLRKVDPPTRVVGSGADRRIIFLPNPFLDFVGVWIECAGRAVFIECKSTREPKLQFDSSSGVTTAQLDALRHWGTAGAVSFVLWQWIDKVKLVPWNVLALGRDMARTSREYKYLEWELAALGPQIGRGSKWVIVDFLAEMRRLWKP